MSLLQLPSFKENAPKQENEADMLFKVERENPLSYGRNQNILMREGV